MELPRTLELALAGELEPWRVDAVVVASQDVAADRLVELESRVYAGDVIDLPKPRLVERVRRAAAKADPEGMTRGVRRAPRRRGLRVAPSETTGLMRWSLEVPDEMSRRMFAAVDELAQEYLTADSVAAAGAGAHGSAPSAWRGQRARGPSLAAAFGGGRSPGRARGPGHGQRPRRDRHRARRPGRRRRGDNRHPPQSPRRRHRRAHQDPLPPRRHRTARLTGPHRPGGHRSRPRPGTGGRPCLPRGRPGPGRRGSRVDEVAVDLVLGSVTEETLAAGELERRLGLVLGAWLEVAANPFLTHHRPPPAEPPQRPRPQHRRAREGIADGDSGPPPWPSTDGVWFVDGLVEAPGAAAAAARTGHRPAQRPRHPRPIPWQRSRPRRRRQPSPPHLPPRCEPSPVRSAPGTGTAASPAAASPRTGATSTTSSPSPAARPSKATCRRCAPPTTASSTMPAGGSP